MTIGDLAKKIAADVWRAMASWVPSDEQVAEYLATIPFDDGRFRAAWKRARP